MKSIGFIGLGTMGSPMVMNLLNRGYTVSVYNRTMSRTEELARLGADVVPSAAEAARAADVLFTMVSDDAALEDVFYGEEGIMSGLKPGLTIFDCSTVSPELSRRLHSELSGHYIDFLDAPVSGSKPAAIGAKLYFMVGGNKEALDENADILLPMGAGYSYMGQAGSGSQSKLALNTIVGLNMAALAEGMAIAARSGIDLEAFVELIGKGGAASRIAELKGNRLLNRDFSPQFAMKLMLKDLQLAQAQTAKLQLPTPLLQSAENLYRIGMSKGLGEDDFSAVIHCYDDWSDQSIAKNKENAANNRRRAVRVPLKIRLQISIYQWQVEGSFSGQQIEAFLYDLSESGMQIICDVPLATDMFVVIHFPQEAELPPVTSKIIRIERKGDTFHYGCLISGMAPYTRKKLEAYIQQHIESLGN